MNFALLAADSSAAGGGLIMMVIYMVIIFGAMYFFAIRPQRKEQKRLQTMISQMEVGDVVVTNSGFYGTVISVSEDDCIVEFGNNKNCRIPMRKSAIAEIEKASDSAAATAPAETKSGADEKTFETKKSVVKGPRAAAREAREAQKAAQKAAKEKAQEENKAAREAQEAEKKD